MWADIIFLQKKIWSIFIFFVLQSNSSWKKIVQQIRQIISHNVIRAQYYILQKNFD